MQHQYLKSHLVACRTRVQNSTFIFCGQQYHSESHNLSFTTSNSYWCLKTFMHSSKGFTLFHITLHDLLKPSTCTLPPLFYGLYSHLGNALPDFLIRRSNKQFHRDIRVHFYIFFCTSFQVL